MRIDWLPVSAASLVIGATGLFYVARTLPRPDGAGEVLQSVAQIPDGLLSPAIIMMMASTAFIFGLPTIFTLFRPAAVLGLLGLALMLLGGVVMVSFSHQLLVIRTLSREHPMGDDVLAAVMQDTVSGTLLTLGFVGFYVGELFVAWELAQVASVPRWISWAFLVHVASAVASLPFEPGVFHQVPSIFMTAALAGAGIVANMQHHPRSHSSGAGAVRHTREEAAWRPPGARRMLHYRAWNLD